MKNFMNNFGMIVGTMCMMAAEDDACASVDGFSRPNKEIMEQIKKEEEERLFNEKKNAAKNQMAEDDCRQKYEAIDLRKKRAYARAQEDRLKKRTEENRKYQEGELDTEVHRQNLEKIQNEYEEAIRIADREFNKACDNLETAAGTAMYRKVTRGW
jgi:hypothetical protein